MMRKNIILTVTCMLSLGAIAFGQATTTQTTTTKTTVPAAKTVTATTVTTTTAQTAQTLDQKAVRAVFDALVKGINNADAKAVTAVYQNSPATLYFNNNGSVTRGWDQDRQNKESIYAKVTNVNLTPTNVRVETLGAIGAVLTCQWTQTQDYNGVQESASGRMTLVFKKVGAAWKAIHLHTSPDVPAATRPVFPSERATDN